MTTKNKNNLKIKIGDTGTESGVFVNDEAIDFVQGVSIFVKAGTQTSATIDLLMPKCDIFEINNFKLLLSCLDKKEAINQLENILAAMKTEIEK